MNGKTMKIIISSLIFINCLLAISAPAIATNISYYNNPEDLTFYAHKDKDKKHKGFDIFSEENYKYLSHEQKKELLELKKCKDKGDAFSEEQQKTLHSLIDCIIKGKLGDTKYEEYKCLIEKKKSNEQLTEEEDKKLKEYRDIISGNKPTTTDILNQFLR